MNLVWTDPRTHISQREPFTGGIAQVIAKADAVQAAYAQEAPGEYPGLALEVAEDEPESLAIGVTPYGWALIHADDDAVSWRTAGDYGDEGQHTVTWSVPDDLPASWLIPRERALQAVEYWLRGHRMDPALTWVGNWD